jgi:hypothetical protein
VATSLDRPVVRTYRCDTDRDTLLGTNRIRSRTAAGQRDQLLGRIQERYGYAKEKAEKELDEFVSAAMR